MNTMRRLAPITLLAGLLLPVSLFAQTIKMGTAAPSNSPWDAALRTLASEWSADSGGRVTLRIYPGGIAGNDQDMIRKMRIGQLQAAALAGQGLNNIVSDALVLDLPFLFDSVDEFRYVLQRVTPDFERKFQEKGFVLLGWNIAGWINFFSKSPVVTPQDLMAQKLSVSGDDPAVVQAWKEAGFQVVPVAFNDVMTALSSGMVDALYTEPVAAAAYQWFGIANNMCDLKILPLIGGIVVSDRAWRQIPDQYKESLKRDVEGVMTPIYEQTQSLEQQAMGVMKQNGLVVNHVAPDVAAKWRDIMTSGYKRLAGQSYSIDTYERVMQLIDEYRSGHGG